MPSVVSCPHCGDAVTLPEGSGADLLVQCPYCAEVYPLAEIRSQLPPPLIVVGQSPSEDQQPIQAPADPLRPDFSLPSIRALRAEPTDVDSESHSTDKSESRSESVSESASVSESESDSGGDSQLEKGWSSPTLVSEEIREDEDQDFRLAPPDAPSRPPSFVREDESPSASLRSQPRRPTRSRARNSGGKPIREVVKIVAGGVVGLTIGQLILWWMPGNWTLSNRDPAGIGARFGTYAPWLVPASVRGESQVSLGGDDYLSDDYRPRSAPFESPRSNGSSTDPSRGSRAEQRNGTDPEGFSDSFSEGLLEELFEGLSEGYSEDFDESFGDDVPAEELNEENRRSLRPDRVAPASNGRPNDDPLVDFPSNDSPRGEAETSPIDDLETTDDSPAVTDRVSDPVSDPVSDREADAESDAPHDPQSAEGAAESDRDEAEPERSSPSRPENSLPTSRATAVREAPRFEPAQLAAVVEEVREGVGNWNEIDAETGALTVYAALARASMVVPFTDAAQTETRSSVTRLRRLLTDVLEDDSLRQGVVTQAGVIPLGDRTSQEGTLVMGVVDRVESRGRLFATTIQQENGDRVTVISTVDPGGRLPLGQEILALGIAILEPRRELIGYEGDSEPVLYGSLVVPTGR